MSLTELEQIRKRSMLIDPDTQRLQDEKKLLLEKRKEYLESNSIFAKVKEKDFNRFLKFKDIEAERRKLDDLEHEFQQEKKKAIIKEANGKVFQTFDKVKKFK